jgi:flagella basal body P-ring formation protein FlgA
MTAPAYKFNKTATVAVTIVALVSLAAPVSADAPAKRPARKPSTLLVQQARRMASEAIVRYLRENVADEAWRVTAEVSDEQAQLIATADELIAASGGESPWVGRQQFELRVRGAGAALLSVTAEVALPAAVVVATHAVPRGAIVRATDIELQRVSAETPVAGTFQTAAEVVGKEATKSIAPGQMLDANYLRSQILVHSGEVVTLYGRNAGITVRMTARAQENGAQGELVSVESILDRKRLLARVCGLQEVEIYAGAAASAPSVIEGRSGATKRNE